MLAVIVYENKLPFVAVTELALLITGAESDALTVRVRVAEPVPTAFVALMVTMKVPNTVGVPLTTPVLVFTDRPAGRPVAL